MFPEPPAGPLTRRLALVFLLVLCLPAPAAERLFVAAGEVTGTTAVIWLRSPAEGAATVEYGPAGAASTATATLRVGPASDLTGKLRLTGLSPATRYAYRVTAGGVAATGAFLTAPAPDDAARVKFVWSGDLGGGRFCRPLDTGYRIFSAMGRQKPDFFLFVGDTVYADHRCGGPGVVPGSDFVARSLRQFRDKHRYQREDAVLGTFLGEVSVYAIWDDHEVRNDFAGPTEPLMPVGRQAFLDYWPILPPAEDPTRLYRKARWGRLLEVFILDTRQYRSDNSQPDGPGKTMLGPAQRRWLIDEVAASTATWKVVVSSVPLSVPTGGRNHDSWSNASVWGLPEDGGTGFALERDAMLKAFRDRGVKNLIVLAADVHHAELIRHHPTPGFAFHEFIAGPLSATFGRPRPLDAALNPRSLFARGGLNNFGEVTIGASHLVVRLIDEEGTELFTHTIGPE